MDYIIIALLLVTMVFIAVLFVKLSNIGRKISEIPDNRQDLVSLSVKQDVFSGAINDNFSKMSQNISTTAMQNEQKLDNMRRTLADSIAKMQEDNSKQLETIRKTVDEKLQDTLDKKLNDSFKLVSERLEQVYRGLGEMQTIASSVGDLKKVLSNVKTRGVLGEIALGAILEQVLNNDQYAKNVATKKGSQANVEYAIKLPGDGETPVWLPIDAKFPADAYSQLVDAYDSGDTAAIDVSAKALRDRLRSFAKDIHDKYISPPNTTDFAIMFLPVEGLYAEAVRMGLVETLQNDYKINIAGPTTMAALLNSLQMGFKTLAIQKRSGEVWNILGVVKTEFESFASVLETTQKRLSQANDDLDKLIGVRTRKIQRTLSGVQNMPVAASDILEEDNE